MKAFSLLPPATHLPSWELKALGKTKINVLDFASSKIPLYKGNTDFTNKTLGCEDE